MAKSCISNECSNPVWGGGYCQRHQALRSDKKPQQSKVRKPLKKKLKPTGEYAMFQAIWATRPHIDFITGQPIPEPRNKPDGTPDIDVRCFMHVLGKGAYPKYRLKLENIVLGNPETHDLQTNRGKTWLLDNHPKFMKFFMLQTQLREQYNREST